MSASSPSLRYVVCYDVPNDRRRSKISRCLDDFGARVQYSVYEMVLDRPLFDKLVARLTTLIEPETDRLSIYPLCGTCQRKAVFLGLADLPVRPGDEIVFVF